MFSHGSTQNLKRCLFPLHLIKEGIFAKNTNFNLTDITGDERLLALLPPKNSNYYPLSDFCKEVNDFDLTLKDFVNFHGFENEEYKYNHVEINNVFFPISCIATKAKRITILTFYLFLNMLKNTE